MQPPPTIFKLSIKKKNYKIFFWGGEGGGGEMEMPSQIRSNSLPWASKKLHCKGEPYRFSGERDPLLQTISLLLYILGYIFDCLSIYLFNCLSIYLFNCLSIYLFIYFTEHWVPIWIPPQNINFLPDKCTVGIFRKKAQDGRKRTMGCLLH